MKNFSSVFLLNWLVLSVLFPGLAGAVIVTGQTATWTSASTATCGSITGTGDIIQPCAYTGDHNNSTLQQAGITSTAYEEAKANAEFGVLGASALLTYTWGRDWYGASAVAQTASIFQIQGNPNESYEFAMALSLDGDISAGIDTAIKATASGRLNILFRDPVTNAWGAGISYSNLVTANDRGRYNSYIYQNGFASDSFTSMYGDTQFYRADNLSFTVPLDSSGYSEIWTFMEVSASISENGSFSCRNYYTECQGDSGGGYSNFYNTMSSTLYVPDGVQVTSAGPGWGMQPMSALVPVPSALLLFASGMTGLAGVLVRANKTDG